MSGPSWTFEIYLDRAGHYRWRLKAPNSQVVAEAPEGYRTAEEAEKAAHIVRDQSRFAEVTGPSES